MYFLLGISLMFALLLAVNVSASLAAAAIWFIVDKFVLIRSARTRARFIFGLRVFPFAAALVFVCAFLLPSYFLYEPNASGENVGVKLSLLAALSAVGMAAAFYRVFATFWRTQRLVKDWLRHSEKIAATDSKVPLYRLAHPFPVVAVTGFFRPRIFVAEQVFDLLDEDELAAAIAHEHGHLAAFDNLKRWTLRVCRDLLVFPIGKTLDRIWAETAETAADEHVAAIGGNSAALNLAAALLKIARNIPQGATPTMPSGAFLIGKESAMVAERVRHLVELTGKTNDFKSRNPGLTYSVCFAFGIISILVLWLMINNDFLLQVHNLLENVVDILQ